MPRPKRARQAPPTTDPKPAESVAATDLDDEQRGRARGRTRSTRSMGGRLSLDEENAIRAANQRRDAALDSLANDDPTVTSGPDDTRSSVEIGRRAMATPAMRRDTTGLDLADDDVFGDLGDSFADGDVPEAPHSAASSSATMSHFKTRPRSRQSSIIGRNDPPIRPNSRASNTPGVSSTFNIGVFRRRAREPSILGTSRRARSQTGSVAGSVASSRAGSVARDSELESEGEFAPEAESTPLNNRRRSRRSEQHVERELSPSPGGRRRSMRKRKSDDNAQSETSRPEKISRVEANGGMDISTDSELSELASPSPPAARFARAVTPINMDEINAPPASSDSEADDNIWPDIHTLAKKRRRPSITTPVRNDKDDLSDVSSPPSLTHSPNYNARARGTKHPRSPQLTTADLTSLLPKRRYKRNRDDFGIDTDAEEEDDEANTETRSRRRKNSRPPSRATSRNVLKPKQTPASVRRSARTTSKTYRPEEDKENESEDEPDNSQFQPLPDDTFDVGAAMAEEVQNADELKKASKKFKEVDKWELSFEEDTEELSPQDAR